MDHLKIEHGEPGRLIVRFAFSRDKLEKIKSVPGRRWHPILKAWTVPAADAMERLLFLAKIEKGLQQADAGQTIPHDKVKQKMKRWLK